jgi:uncharacterized membrane protein YfcA
MPCSSASSSAVYDGALGPGTGSFYVFALVGWLGYAFLQASAKAKIANFATNLGALTVFVPAGSGVVAWSGWLMGAAQPGRRLSRRSHRGAPGQRLRPRTVFVVVVGAFIVRLGGAVLGVWP